MDRRRLLALILPLLAAATPQAAPRPALADDAKTLSPAEIARLGRPATALVVVEGFSKGEGSAFCVRPDGMFVTNHHVIESSKFSYPDAKGRRVAAGKVTLVLDSGRDNQRVVPARVLRSDPAWDLALLQADGVEGFPALGLATEADLAATRDVVAFGFPLGSALSVQNGTYPTANVNKGTIRAIKRVGDWPATIEADLSINPGNSGGPLLDNRGRVAGVIYARVEAPGKPGFSLAVPVNRLESFLSRPEIAFEPPTVTRAAKEKPVEFKASLSSRFPPKEPPTMELVLGAWGKGARHFPMTLGGGIYRVEAPLVAGENWPRGVKLTTYEITRTPVVSVAWVEDRMLKGDDLLKGTQASFPLASTDQINVFPTYSDADTPLNSYQPIRRIVGVAEVLAAIKDQEPSFAQPLNTKLVVDDVTDDETIVCSVVARQAGRLVARVSTLMTPEDPEGATLKAVSEGRFVRPHHSPTRVNSLRVFIPKGDPAAQVEVLMLFKNDQPPRLERMDDREFSVNPGPDDPARPGRVYQYDYKPPFVPTRAGEVYFYLDGKRRGLKISELGPVKTSIQWLLADSDTFKVGEFAIQAPESFDPRGYFAAAGHLQMRNIISGKPDSGKPDCSYSGRFRVWEFVEEARGRKMKLAVDFLMERKPEQPGGRPIPSIVGMVRVNSRYQ